MSKSRRASEERIAPKGYDQRGQASVVGFIMILLIVLVVMSSTFIWARPIIERTINVNEVYRMENRMLELHDAIIEVANERSQRSVPFTIEEGWLQLQDNNTIIFVAPYELPDSFVLLTEKGKVLAGNNSEVGPCLNSSNDFGKLGYDSPGCLTERGSTEMILNFIVLNDTAANKCYGILLESGQNAGAGKGAHDILLKFEGTNTSSYAGCAENVWQRVSIDVR